MRPHPPWWMVKEVAWLDRGLGLAGQPDSPSTPASGYPAGWGLGWRVFVASSPTFFTIQQAGWGRSRTCVEQRALRERVRVRADRPPVSPSNSSLLTSPSAPRSVPTVNHHLWRLMVASDRHA